MHVVYILFSIKFDRYYVGLSSDFGERLKTHNSGRVTSTKAFKPWELFHLEEFETRIEARTREKYLKSAAGRKWRKNNLGM
ncbi:GIY-YIG nuclease family protein [uncultured Gelidibacter sp.]|uniref:GIY-YIG nuclease family protein n=1 Tax=uncultured Gelidibacter sp. TaxID=259318 RepID=UPI002630C262|nr:GIY-YIG nuclease family protein [uncultured Gelidibacter sp.]